MIYSMTGFIRQEIQNEDWTATWEIRSINQRYLEIQIYLPEILRALEVDIRKKINNTHNINRGRIECKLHINTNYNNILNNEIIINTQLINNLIKLIKNIPDQKNIKKIDPIKILSWPNVIIPKKLNIQNIYPTLLQSFENALHKLIKIRKNEGTYLQKIIEQRLLNIKYEINKIKEKIPLTIPSQRNKILKKIHEITTNVNNNRLEEELIIYAQRLDIAEEIDRLEIHTKNIDSILSEEKVVGRKTDFIMQEIYRETNTVSSKSTNIEIIQSCIEIKVLIDQIREQIQNIE